MVRKLSCNRMAYRLKYKLNTLYTRVYKCFPTCKKCPKRYTRTNEKLVLLGWTPLLPHLHRAYNFYSQFIKNV